MTKFTNVNRKTLLAEKESRESDVSSCIYYTKVSGRLPFVLFKRILIRITYQVIEHLTENTLEILKIVSVELTNRTN